MSDEASAVSMVDYFTKASPTVRGRVVYVQFSNHRELKTEGMHGNLVSGSVGASFLNFLYPSYFFLIWRGSITLVRWVFREMCHLFCLCMGKKDGFLAFGVCRYIVKTQSPSRTLGDSVAVTLLSSLECKNENRSFTKCLRPQ